MAFRLLILLLFSAVIIVIIIIVVLIILLCVVCDDHFIDLIQHIFGKPLAEFNKQRRNKRNLVFISRKTDEILIVRVFPDLFNQFFIGKVILLLDQQRTECHAQRFCRHSCMARKQFCILSLNCFPRDHFRLLYPAVFRVQLYTKRLIEICE